MNKIIFIIGPTASGKTDVAVKLAKKINAEIISCDSMQIYKGMDIVSSMPSKAQLKAVPHYLVGLIPPNREYNVSKYRIEALKKIKAIIKKGKIPLFVGGTGLYMSILIDGIFGVDTENKTLREKLYQKAQDLGSQYLHNKLNEIDPDAAFKIHPNDTKRIIRALEVFEVTGKPISVLQKQRSGLASEYNVRIFGLNMERVKLYERSDSRVDKMFQKGLIKEIKGLLKLKLSKTAGCAIGIKELKGYFDGLYDLDEAKRLMKRNSRHYAKRQMTWFRKDKRVNWIDVTNKLGFNNGIRVIASEAKQSPSLTEIASGLRPSQ